MRKLALALAFSLFAAAPALAQPCPAIPALPDTERRTEYTGVSSSTGPFNVGFQLYGDGTDVGNWLEVWVNGTRKIFTADFTVATASGPAIGSACLPITNAQVTFLAAQSGTIEIIGARRPRRTSQLAENAGVTAHAFNQLNSDIIAGDRERWDLKTRILFGPPGETITGLPKASTRANSILGFDATGLVPTMLSASTGLGTVIGPSVTVAGNLVSWNSTNGTIVADSGVAASSVPFLSANNVWTGRQTFNPASGIGVTLNAPATSTTSALVVNNPSPAGTLSSFQLNQFNCGLTTPDAIDAGGTPANGCLFVSSHVGPGQKGGRQNFASQLIITGAPAAGDALPQWVSGTFLVTGNTNAGGSENALSATVGAAGAGYTNGAQTLTSTGGTCTTQPQFSVTVAGNVVTAVNSVSTAGACTVRPTNPVATTGGGGTGATLNITFGISTLTQTQGAIYPLNPFASLVAGATGYSTAISELDIQNATGSSVWYSGALSLVSTGLHKVKASYYDTMLSFSGQTGTVGSDSMILVGPMNSAYPFTANSTFLLFTNKDRSGAGTTAGNTIDKIIDASLVTINTCTVNIAFGCVINGAGAFAGTTFLHTNQAAPSSPAAGKVIVYSDSTDLRFHDKNASGVIGTTVVADTGASNNFLTGVTAAGAITKAQPATTNLSDISTFSLNTSGTIITTNATASTTTTTGAVKATGGISSQNAINGTLSVSAWDGAVQTAIKSVSGSSVGQVGTVSNHAFQVIVNNASVATFVAGFQSGGPASGDPGTGGISAQTYVQTGIVAVASLPTCNGTREGARYYVSDQNTAVAYRGAVTGGGATRQAVLCSNNAWIQD